MRGFGPLRAGFVALAGALAWACVDPSSNDWGRDAATDADVDDAGDARADAAHHDADDDRVEGGPADADATDLPGSGVIDAVLAAPATVEPGGSATVTVEIRCTGPGTLRGASVNVDAYAPAGAIDLTTTNVPDLLPGASATVSQEHGPLDAAGTWTFVATLLDADGAILDLGPEGGAQVVVEEACDRSCVCGYYKPSCWASHEESYAWYWRCFENVCPHCGDAALQYFRSSELDGLPREYPDPMPEHFVRCWTGAGGCDADYCGICGREHIVGSSFRLTPCDRPCPATEPPPP